MPKSPSVPADSSDARVLLHQPPDDYVAERTRLVKLARAAGDRPRATFLQSLKRPNLALWAVLAAGDDGEAVRALMTATTELAEVQAGGARATALSTSTRYRRVTLEALVDSAVAALARSVPSAQARRGEIRDIIDQLSRHPDLADAWIDATLRDLPEEEFGFGAFTGLPDTTEAEASIPARRAPAPPKAATPRAPEPARRRSSKPVDDRAARAARTQQTTQARKDIAAAVRELAAAERRVAVARTAFDEAATELHQAEQKHDAAEQRHREAIARLTATT